MNRTALGLAVGAGYVLGRTKKMKLAFAIGSLVAGKKLNLSPGAVKDLVNRQLLDNPQFKEIGDQVRQDLRGVGKAATGAMVERRMDVLADRLHSRTAEVQDQLAGVVPGGGDSDADEDDGEKPEGRDGSPASEDEDREAAEDREDTGGEDTEGDEPADEVESGGPAGRAAEKAPAKKTSAGKPAARSASAGKAPARKATAKSRSGARRTAARKTSAVGAARSRRSKDGDEV